MEVGGGEIFPMSLAAELSRRGHQVWLFNQRAELRDEALVARLLPPAVRVVSMHDYPTTSFLAHKTNGMLTRLMGNSRVFERVQQACLARLIRREGIEVVNSHSTYADRMCAAALRETGLPIPLVITEQGEYRRFIEEGAADFREVLQAADAIVCVSEFNRQLLVRNVRNLPPSSCIYNAAERASTPADGVVMRNALGIGADDFVFGMVARGIEAKGWACAAAAFEQLRTALPGQPLHLVLVGEGEYFPELRRQYEGKSGIHFVGKSPNPAYYMAGFDVGLLPTFFASEALPVVITEYLSHFLPVISTVVGGIAEVIGSGATACGQLLTLDAVTGRPNTTELTVAMRAYCENAALYEAHVANARRASQQFSMGASTSQYEQAFARIMAARHAKNSFIGC